MYDSESIPSPLTDTHVYCGMPGVVVDVPFPRMVAKLIIIILCYSTTEFFINFYAIIICYYYISQASHSSTLVSTSAARGRSETT